MLSEQVHSMNIGLAEDDFNREDAEMTDKHYFVEMNDDGKFAVRAKGSERASSLHDTQAEAITEANRLNPSDQADVERVRTSAGGGPDKWRAS